ncbi:hypothetical protein FB451DRAFT_1389386 [Mycena latifolia]|nr:hypothetical protein FB451DRAFT_1389386 [Mycena latifolia]
MPLPRRTLLCLYRGASCPYAAPGIKLPVISRYAPGTALDVDLARVQSGMNADDLLHPAERPTFIGAWADRWEVVRNFRGSAIGVFVLKKDAHGPARTLEPFFAAVRGCCRHWPTDLSSLIICSDVPDAQVDIGGTAPCHPRPPQYLESSPIQEVEIVKAPLLVLHGEKDARMPLSRAVGFMRGLKNAQVQICAA